MQSRARQRWNGQLKIGVGLIVCVVAVFCVYRESQAIQAESQTEKESNLKGQALAELFHRWTFDEQKPKEPPSGFSSIQAGGGGVSTWDVRPDSNAPSSPNILSATSSCQSTTCYRMLLVDDLQYEYPDISVRMRAPDDARSSSGGLIISAKGSDNFYAAIVNMNEKTVRIVRMVNGKETVLSQASISPKAVDWHSLRVQRDTIISKDVIEVFFDGLLMLSVRDQSLGTGQVGLLAYGETTLLFDSLYAAPLFSQRPLSNPAAY
ncbi:hypothetical protein W02_14390 [Nitrospira sp. KM1]|uniref:hypothetical protein n=1 Tax=Nitrospira sp. KM1 TaxID=1936990 RepID=UPI0013A772D5|nr:hypothetical protein [Nitrospira sp. KM1]BCA54299.1 hypothetical protein W02_14390 [Nitrospira sp. KM1]